MAYRVSTLEKRPAEVSRINLGEKKVWVRLCDRVEMLKLLKLTRQAFVIVPRWLGPELREFPLIHWTGGSDPRLYFIWNKLCIEDRCRLAPALGFLAREDPDKEVRLALARKAKDLVDMLALVEDPEEEVRLALAARAKSVGILERLASDPSLAVRYAVAANKHTPKKVLDQLVLTLQGTAKG